MSIEQYNYLVIGIGYDTGRTRGDINCKPKGPECPTGAPGYSVEADGSDFSNSGYIQPKGHQRVEVLGGRQFASLPDAEQWLKTADGTAFSRIFRNVFIARVQA